MSGKKVKALLALAMLATGVSVWAQPAADEERVGEVAAARILGAAPLLDAPAAQKYLNMVGAAVAQRTEGGYKWRFGLVKTDSVNAFAAPGGFVLVTTGLMKQLQSEDELAFVLAHEVAHVLRQHHYRVVQRQRLAEAAAKTLQATTGEAPDAALSQASAQIYARGLDKSSEFEADRIGAELMTRAGYDPAAAVGVLERLQRLKGDDPRAELLFSTHPSPAERLDTLLQSGLEGLPRPAQDSITLRSARFAQLMSNL